MKISKYLFLFFGLLIFSGCGEEDNKNVEKENKIIVVLNGENIKISPIIRDKILSFYTKEAMKTRDLNKECVPADLVKILKSLSQNFDEKHFNFILDERNVTEADALFDQRSLEIARKYDDCISSLSKLGQSFK